MGHWPAELSSLQALSPCPHSAYISFSVYFSLSLCLLPPASHLCLSLALVFLCKVTHRSHRSAGLRSRLGRVTPPQPPPLAAHSSEKQACEIFPGKRLLLAMGSEKERKIKSLCNHSAAQLPGSLTQVLLRYTRIFHFVQDLC